jgi:hypothetical protein
VLARWELRPGAIACIDEIAEALEAGDTKELGDVGQSKHSIAGNKALTIRTHATAICHRSDGLWHGQKLQRAKQTPKAKSMTIPNVSMP